MRFAGKTKVVDATILQSPIPQYINSDKCNYASRQLTNSQGGVEDEVQPRVDQLVHEQPHRVQRCPCPSPGRTTTTTVKAIFVVLDKDGHNS